MLLVAWSGDGRIALHAAASVTSKFFLLVISQPCLLRLFVFPDQLPILSLYIQHIILTQFSRPHYTLSCKLARLSRAGARSSAAMVFIRRRPSLLLLVALLCVVIISFLSSSASAQGKTGQVTVFWGRHRDEGSLREACDSGKYTMVIMSFLDVYGSGDYNLDISGHPFAGMGDAIKRCQFLGVPVSISIGGFGAGGYSLPTNQSALALFEHLWNTYFGGNLNGTGRPFGEAWLDGVDMFLEHGTPAEHYNVLALELAKHNIRAGDGKLLHLTATPHCRFPDTRVKEALDTGIFERIHVRFYDDPDCVGFDAKEWSKWTAAYPFTKIYVGLPASAQAAKTGYTDPRTLRNAVLPVAQRATNYGGVMLWDRYFDKRSNYSGNIKNWI